MAAKKPEPRSAVLRRSGGDIKAKTEKVTPSTDYGHKQKRKKHRKERLKLKRHDRKKIQELMKRGRESVRVLRRAQVLRLLNAGESPYDVAEVLGCATSVVYRAKWQYIDGGLEEALRDAPRPGQTPVLNDKQKQQVVAMVCGPAPEGMDRWTIRLIAEEVVKRKIVPRIGRETIRIVLRDHALKPWREKNVVYSGINTGVCGADGGRSGPLRETVESKGTGGLSG